MVWNAKGGRLVRPTLPSVLTMNAQEGPLRKCALWVALPDAPLEAGARPAQPACDPRSFLSFPTPQAARVEQDNSGPAGGHVVVLGQVPG